ncbi:tryptophan synthase, beta chain [Desulfocapsa sulfexigens DSM 10523]|uniref:Tryptophan synthase beta chain n=1 Tax=Desulfocapsa sulfexigens (strain DSM 10523 / SB164P1) TaxID=1167006 RepID=M1PJW7_DESSD|nr:tryptophan synthase subunit beta [Desulfocapsa sulfexigens]AGF79850.1 tryptophan synthase, beta chain [Desulfocapsa sulfexigens DSM 10523]
MDSNGFFGNWGGAYIPEVLHQTFQELKKEYDRCRKDPAFWQEYLTLMSTYSCRPTPLTYAENLTRHFGGAQIYIKREDLNHTGAHKANNVMGQGLLVKRMGKKRVIAETGAGQHGMATATMAAKFGLDCTIYMGEEDVMRQRPNVFWMEKMGATVVPVTDGSRTLKDAINEAFRDWVTNVDDTHYVFGTACGPAPFPEMVAWFQSIIGIEAAEQIIQYHHKMPKRVYACVGGGSNAMGIFKRFLDEDGIELVGVEAGGHGAESGAHAIRLSSPDASPGVAQGYKTMFLQDDDGQMKLTHSVAAGLDYVGVSPILSDHWENKRVRFESATDTEVMQALDLTMRLEGIIPALESSHAFAGAFREVGQLSKDDAIIINQSGRGDKDIFTIAHAFEDPSWKKFIIDRGREYSNS